MKLVINAIMTRPGGALTVLLGMLRAWQELGHATEIVVLASHPGVLEKLAGQQPNCKVEPLLVDRRPSQRLLWQRFRLDATVRRLRGEVVLTNNHFLAGLSVPQVVHHHNLWRFASPDFGAAVRRGVANRLRDRAARAALRHAAANVFVSEYLRSEAVKSGIGAAERFYVIPNCLDDRTVDLAGQFQHREIKTFRLLAVQSANTQKDNQTLIGAMRALTEMAPSVDWRLEIAGGSGRADWNPVRQQAADYGIANNIAWLDFVTRNELDNRLRQSLCLISTSRFESSGLTLLEAMAQGCPVVGSKIPAYEEYAADAAAYVAPGDALAFGQAVCELREKPERRRELINRGLERIESYRWSRWGRRFLEILESAANRTSS